MSAGGILSTRTSQAAGGLLILGLLGLAACNDDGPVAPPPGEPIEHTFTFEQDMEGWVAVATDTLNPPIDWHVEHTTEQARTGEGSVELHLENFNDAGKIWMEQTFVLEPGVTYDVEVRYAFGTADWGDVNLFTIIAGVHETPPRHAEDLTYQEETGHGEGPEAGYVWLNKEYGFTIGAPADGAVHVALGVWGTWETIRTYYIDDVTVVFTPVEG